MTFHKRKTRVLVIVAVMVLAIILLFPTANTLLIAVRTHSYAYSYSLPKDLIAESTSNMPPAEAVPILMYHGVIAGKSTLGTNTKREDFIAQMEMLKRNGYQTISVKEYDLFRQGKFILPPKPIIITFDDGRKDSFFTVDEIFRKLGFKATVFVATGRTNAKDPFFLSWDTLRYMKDSGRWEIEAHGRDSHNKFVNDEEGTVGTYLTSRMYTAGTGLESIQDYESRVHADYRNNADDLKNNLGITAKYFAVPLNHYGDDDGSNYKGSDEYNKNLVDRYFRLAFIEASDKDNKVFESFYNYKDTHKMYITRLEVKGMSAEQLLFALKRFAPTQPFLEFSGHIPEGVSGNFELLYGNLDTQKGVDLSSDTTTPSARILFGDKGWKDYVVYATVEREKGQDTSVLAYYTDEENFIELTWGKDLVTLIEHTGGTEHELASYYPWNKKGTMQMMLYVYHDTVRAYMGGEVITSGAKTSLTRGAAGFSVWGPVGAESIIKKLEIKPLLEFNK